MQRKLDGATLLCIEYSFASKNICPWQVILAIKLKLGLVLHIRDAEEDGLRVLEEAGLPGDYPVHRHCFTGSSLGELLYYCKHVVF